MKLIVVPVEIHGKMMFLRRPVVLVSEIPYAEDLIEPYQEFLLVKRAQGPDEPEKGSDPQLGFRDQVGHESGGLVIRILARSFKFLLQVQGRGGPVMPVRDVERLHFFKGGHNLLDLALFPDQPKGMCPVLVGREFVFRSGGAVLFKDLLQIGVILVGDQNRFGVEPRDFKVVAEKLLPLPKGFLVFFDHIRLIILQ